MTDREVLFSRYSDKKNDAEKKSMITNTNFLSIDERNELFSLQRKSADGIKTYYYGGFEEAERTIAVFVPDFYEISNDICNYFQQYPEDNPLCAVRIDKDKFSDLSHRDYLGSLMGLGLKREMIGDIITDGNGAYVICLKSIAEYVCDNLEKSGRGSVCCEIIDINEIKIADEKFTVKLHSVASLRLDNVLSAGFNITRPKCVQLVAKGIVYVNSVRATKPDMPVKEKDKIVLRGKGKILLYEINGESRKGRIIISIKYYN